MPGDRLLVTKRERYAPPVEVVERKGAGHPDTLCDHLVERLACRLSAAYLEIAGTIRHFNVDKGLLVAGAVEVGLGGGREVRPFHVIVAGRADVLDGALPLSELAEALRAELATVLPDASPTAFDVELRLNPPAPELARLPVVAGGRPPLANDTSVAVVSLPRSPLEEAVYRVERHLTSPDVRHRLPLGPDVKVMAARVNDTITMTVAAAVLARHVADVDAYVAVVRSAADATRAIAEAVLGQEVTVAVNAADGGSPYLTLCGSSAEAGDDGQVGRGNRFGGLITPGRPMSLEACAGKNPVAHVGKTYHATGYDIAERVLADTDAQEVTVTLLSRIGSPVTRPELAHLAIVGDADPGVVRRIVDERLEDWQGVRDRLLAGRYVLF